jgi:lipoprotein-anchoring transpeptidase ErfK/SrfK
MMRRLFAALTVLLTLAIAVPAAASITMRPNAEDQLLLKKKRIAALRADARKRAELAAEARRRADERRYVSRRECGGFLECLFGKPRNSARQLRRSAGRDFATAQVITWEEAGGYAPGSIIIRTPERSLYYVLGDGKARRYKVGVGRDGFQWSGNSHIVSKQEWPSWTPPQVMIEREAAKGHFIPAFMEGGPGNPLGARAMYIGGTMFRIHGTNDSSSIGGAVSSGCIRMMNSDVVDLYERVNIGAKVYVYQ